MTELTCHPATPCDAVRRIQVMVHRAGDATLALEYAVEGDIARLRVPGLRTPARAETLWQHTCFEAFVAAEPARGYCELNFSPSSEWAIYAFSAYREGLRSVETAHPPSVSVHREAARLTLEVLVRLEQLPALSPREDLRVALAAVIEEADGGVSYWALAHPPGKPDFHHTEGFALSLSSGAP